MSRYCAIVFSEDDMYSSTTADTIELESRQPRNTGLFNKNGIPIYRLPEPVGFQKREGEEY